MIYVHFDIHKFEFEEYSRKNRMKTIKNEDISVFGPKNYFVVYIRWLAEFLRSSRFF